MPKARRRAGKGRAREGLLGLLSAGWTFLFVLGIIGAMLVASLSLGHVMGSSGRVQFDRVLESRAIDALQGDPAGSLGQPIVLQGPVTDIERGRDFGGASADVLVVGGLEEGHTPLRIFVMGGIPYVFTSSVIHATGTGTQDPIEPARLALLAAAVTVIPIATSNENDVATSVLAFASLFGVLMAGLGFFWERHAAALQPRALESETVGSSAQSPRFLTALTRGRDPLSVSLRMAFLAALGRALFVFGLIAFLYVFVTVYILSAAAVDWWVHHWVPWLRLDVFAALGLIAAFIGLFLFTFVQQLTRQA